MTNFASTIFISYFSCYAFEEIGLEPRVYVYDISRSNDLKEKNISVEPARKFFGSNPRYLSIQGNRVLVMRDTHQWSVQALFLWRILHSKYLEKNATQANL
mmetsp:Transcript_12710/g.17095  ORF Transcript_12710/g.17095 Transcript_12710/m.17095 type:complete len:101 (+) Transcript_12710:193-495(+)